MKHTATFAAAAALSFGLPAAAQAQDAAGPVDVTVGVSAATDYIWRGISQTDGKPAVFGTVQANVGNFYVGGGAENVDFGGIDTEYDLWAGYVLPIGKAKLDLGVVRYGYVDSAADIDTTEFKAALSGNVGKLGLGVAAYHTWNYFGSDEHATYAEVNASYPLTDKLSASGAFGHQQIDNTPDYTTWNAGLSYEVLKGAKLDVRYHDTDTAAFGSLAKARVVGSFSLSF